VVIIKSRIVSSLLLDSATAKSRFSKFVAFKIIVGRALVEDPAMVTVFEKPWEKAEWLISTEDQV